MIKSNEERCPQSAFRLYNTRHDSKSAIVKDLFLSQIMAHVRERNKLLSSHFTLSVFQSCSILMYC